MLFSKVKDKNKRENYLKWEYKKKIQKFVFINLISKLQLLKKARKRIKQPNLYKAIYLHLFKKSVSKVSLVKRCVISNNAKNVYKSFNLSRMVFRDLLQFGLIPGYKKAVW